MGKYHSLLLSTSGTVYESSSTIPQKGSLCYTQSHLHWVVKEGLKSIAHIACGQNHSVALTSDGNAFIWGQNEEGQIPEASASFVETPMKLPFSQCVEIACHGNHTSVLTNNEVLYWPYYRDNTLITHPTRVNTLCYLYLKIVQIACHDGFNTLLTEQGQLFGYYYYIQKNKTLSASAKRLFPSTVQPGCIHALLPSCVRLCVLIDG